MAFWEYLLLLEICYKILEKDKIPHLRNHNIFEPYRALEHVYKRDPYVQEGDFSERMSALLDRIVAEHGSLLEKNAGEMLTEGQVTELIHRHDVKQLRVEITRYLKLKGTLWILIDNLDKGWARARTYAGGFTHNSIAFGGNSETRGWLFEVKH